MVGLILGREELILFFFPVGFAITMGTRPELALIGTFRAAQLRNARGLWG